jgi:hypothetical protein
MKGVLPRLVRWTRPVDTRYFYPALAALVSQVKNIFPRRLLFQFMCKVRQGGGMDRPSQNKSRLFGSLSSSLPGGPPCWVISLAFELIGLSQYRQCVDITDRWARLFHLLFFLSMKC